MKMKIKRRQILAVGLSIVLTLGTAVPSFAKELTWEEKKAAEEELFKLEYTEYSKEQPIPKEVIPDDLFREALNRNNSSDIWPHLTEDENSHKIFAIDSGFQFFVGYPDGMKSIKGYKSLLNKEFVNEYYETQLSENAKEYSKGWGYIMELPESVEEYLDLSDTRIKSFSAMGKVAGVNLKGCYMLKDLTLGKSVNKIGELPDLTDCNALEKVCLASDEYKPDFLQGKNYIKRVDLIGKVTKDINLNHLSNLEEVTLATDDADIIDLSEAAQIKRIYIKPFGRNSIFGYDYYNNPEVADKVKKVKEIKLPNYENDGIKLSQLDVGGNSLAKIDLSHVIFGQNGNESSFGGVIDPETGELVCAPNLKNQYLQDPYEYYKQDGKYVIDLKPVLGEKRYLDKVKVQNQHDGRYGATYDKEKGLLIYDKLPEPGNVNDDYMGYTLMCPDKAQHEWPMNVNFTNLKEGKPPVVSSLKDEATGIELKGEGLRSDMTFKVIPKKDMRSEEVKAAQGAIVKGVPKGYGIFNMYDIKLIQNGKEIKLKQPAELTIPITSGLNSKVIAVKDYDKNDNVYPSKFIKGDAKLGNSSKNYGHTVKNGSVTMTVERLGVLGLIGSEKDVEEAQKAEENKTLQAAKDTKLAEIDKVVLTEADKKGMTEKSVKQAEEKLNALKGEAKKAVNKAKTVEDVKGVKLPDIEEAKKLLKTPEQELLALKEAKLAEIENLSLGKTGAYTEESVKQAEEKLNALKEEAKEAVNKAETAEDVNSVVLPDVEEAKKLLEKKVERKRRIYGPDRYATAIKVADALKEEMGAEKFQNMVVATGRDYPDALSGNYLAKAKNAPILLIDDRQPKGTLDYIKANLEAKGTVYLLGGEGVISRSVKTDLEKQGYKVVRLGGKDRYKTNLNILKEAGAKNEDLLVCTGKDFADSLSASVAERPILLVEKTLNAEQKAYLGANSFRNIYLIGGTGVVNNSYRTAMKPYSTTGVIERISGSNRYATSVAVAEKFFKNPENLVLAYASDFPDGLSGGTLAMSLQGPILLVDNRNKADAIKYAAKLSIRRTVTLGGPALISDGTVNSIVK